MCNTVITMLKGRGPPDAFLQYVLLPVACLFFSFLLSYGITLYAVLQFLFPPANGSGNGNKPDGYNLSHIYM